ncbi:MAG: chromosomal replication initiator protein DnaA [Nitrospirota bacterium]|nr:chromosomal replication initiator protein DnaA [Nitrospirota bacterium]
MKATTIWEQSLELIKGNITEQNYKTWFEATKGVGLNESDFRIEVPNNFCVEWLQDKYLGLIESSLKEVTKKRDIEVSFIVSKSVPKESLAIMKETAATDQPRTTAKKKEYDEIDTRYTFDNFIVGSSNQFAHAASIAVAERPASSYNPLFIYGGVGLGKTHLLKAIGHTVKVKNPSAKMTYASAEQFTNEMINSLRYSKMTEFRERYRGVDVLLIDDIQFIAGKERTEEEFFHTFNTLFEAKKQIVITSDRFPKDINMIEDRLRSRFSWGLIADIQAPDLETKIAILEKKAEQEGKTIPREVSLFIASKIHSNVRELEGSLTRLLAYSSLTGSEITTALARDILRDTLGEKEKLITPDAVLKMISDYYGIKIADIRSKRRTNSIAKPRQVGMYLCRQLANMSFPDIGRFFGNRDHSTVIHACKQIEERKGQGGGFAAEIDTLIDLLRKES